MCSFMFRIGDCLETFADKRGGDNGDFLSSGLFDILNEADVRYINSNRRKDRNLRRRQYTNM